MDEQLLADTKAEIANLGSQAKCAGPRSPAQIDKAAAQVASAQAHVEQLARRSR